MRMAASGQENQGWGVWGSMDDQREIGAIALEIWKDDVKCCSSSKYPTISTITSPAAIAYVRKLPSGLRYGFKHLEQTVGLSVSMVIVPSLLDKPRTTCHRDTYLRREHFEHFVAVIAALIATAANDAVFIPPSPWRQIDVKTYTSLLLNLLLTSFQQRQQPVAATTIMAEKQKHETICSFFRNKEKSPK